MLRTLCSMLVILAALLPTASAVPAVVGWQPSTVCVATPDLSSASNPCIPISEPVLNARAVHDIVAGARVGPLAVCEAASIDPGSPNPAAVYQCVERAGLL